MPEVKYQNTLFDIFAVNPETKEMKAIEVVLASDHKLDEKALLCKNLGINLEVIRPKYNNSRSVSTKLCKLAYAFANSHRFDMLNELAVHPLTHGDLLRAVGLDPIKAAGIFGYHLRVLLVEELIEKREEKYCITERGKNVLSFFLEKIGQS